jgi:hypothetical protein
VILQLGFHFNTISQTRYWLGGFCAGSLMPETGSCGLPDPTVISAGNQGSAKRVGAVRVQSSPVSPCVRNGKMLFRLFGVSGEVPRRVKTISLIDEELCEKSRRQGLFTKYSV